MLIGFRIPPAAADWAADYKIAQDSRITATGYILRNTGIDELPQLFNVLKGDMNLVDPQPIADEERKA
jgi:exopolysaccharide production protein ExoY